MKLKRIIAYFIDFMIVTMISSMIFTLPIFKENYNEYNSLYEEYSEVLIEQMNSGSAEVDDELLNSITYDITKASTPSLIIRISTLILYFGIFAYFLKGQTIGKKIFKIKVTNLEGELPSPGLFVLRSVIITNAIPEIISLFILILGSKNLYLATYNYTSYITMIIYFVIIGFIIFRDDERGLHDVICKTKVIENKE